MTAVRKSLPLRVLLVSATVAAGLISHPLAAQTPPQPSRPASSPADPVDPVVNAASVLNLQRDQAFRARDLEALAALYTADASYVELLPVLQSVQGRAAIELHFQELFDANTTNLETTVRQVARTGDDASFVSGDYSLVVGNEIIVGHFVQSLRREAGIWKIAEHVFARPELITESEQRDAGSD